MIGLADLRNKIKNNKTITTINESNIAFFNNIALRSAPSFHEQYYYFNNFYHTCMQIIGTSEQMGQYEFQNLIEMDNVVLTIDEEYISTNAIKDFLGKSIDDGDEDLSITNKFNNIRKKKEEIQTNANFLEYLNETNEQVKLVTVRIFMKAISKKDLENLVNNVNGCLKDLDIFASIQTNDLQSDVKSILKFDNPIKSIMPTGALADILMHENASIIEPNVSMLGYTRNGVYNPDFSSYMYKSFCVATVGLQGSGKSSLIKRMGEDDMLNGNNVVMLDMHEGEYKGLANRYGIPSVSFNEDKYINGYEIYTTSNENGLITEKDIGMACSLMSEIFKLQSGITNNTIVSLFSDHLSEMYEKYKGKYLSDFSHEDWFISSDILKFVEESEKNDEYQEEAKQSIFEMKVGIKTMIKTYGYLFNHHTNIDIDLSHSVRFDISFLENIKQENVVTAFLTLIMTYIRRACVINEKYNNDKEKGLNKRKLIRPARTLRVIFEEFGTGAKHKVFLNEVDTLMRLTRKARVGFIFALHTIGDIDLNENDDRKALITSIFGLCATYIVGQIDSKTAEYLPKFINGINENDCKVAKEFTKDEVTGERTFIACNDKGQKIKFKSIISPTQETYFGGGV